MGERKTKLVSMKEAVETIEDNSGLLICGSLIRRHPMALIHEIIRQNKKNLTLYGWNNSIDFDMLIGCKVVKEANSSYVGLANVGVCKNFRRACENQEIRWVEHSETTAMDRLVAGSQADFCNIKDTFKQWNESEQRISKGYHLSFYRRKIYSNESMESGCSNFACREG